MVLSSVLNANVFSDACQCHHCEPPNWKHLYVHLSRITAGIFFPKYILCFRTGIAYLTFIPYVDHCLNLLVIFFILFCLPSYWSKSPESPGWGLWNLHTGVSHPGPFWQLLDATFFDTVSTIQHTFAIIWLPAKLGPRSQVWRTTHSWEAPSKGWHWQRPRWAQAPVLQHLWKTVHQRRSCQSHPSGKFCHVPPGSSVWE